MTTENMQHPPLPEGPWNGEIPKYWRKIDSFSHDPQYPVFWARPGLIRQGKQRLMYTTWPRWFDHTVYIQPVPNWRELMAADQAGETGKEDEMKSIRIKVTVDDIHHAVVEITGVEFMRAKDQNGLLAQYLDMLFEQVKQRAGRVTP